ncbi:MAG: hypothetical protein R3D26_25160 [Cyanobacteriota/Melainabacteria group bacterium]
MDEAEGRAYPLTDGSYILSPFRLFSLYHILCDDPKKVVIPQTKRSETAAEIIIQARGTIENSGHQIQNYTAFIVLSQEKDNPISNQQRFSADSAAPSPSNHY